MAVVNYCMGQLNPVLYFINARGEVALPPSTEDALKVKSAMNSRGFELREAHTLAEIDELQRYMETQERERAIRDYNRTESSLADARKSVRERLISRMISSATPEYEKDFIRAYLMLRDDKREHHRNRFTADIAARFVQRDYDNPRNHYEDVANSIPEGKEVECPRCRKFRKLDSNPLCFRCLYGLTDDDIRP